LESRQREVGESLKNGAKKRVWEGSRFPRGEEKKCEGGKGGDCCGEIGVDPFNETLWGTNRQKGLPCRGKKNPEESLPVEQRCETRGTLENKGRRRRRFQEKGGKNQKGVAGVPCKAKSGLIVPSI